MTKYKIAKILIVITLLHSSQGAAVNEVTTDASTNAPTENTSGKPEDKVRARENKDVPKDGQIMQTINQELKTDQIGNIDLQNETLTLQTENKDLPKPIPAPINDKNILNDTPNGTIKEFTESEIMLIHEEFKEHTKENKDDTELSYYTKPMGHDINTKQVNDPAIQNNNALVSEHKETETEHNTVQEEVSVLQKLAEDKMNLMKENSDKENRIKKLEKEKTNLVKRIIESIDNVVNNTNNNTEKKDLKELKSIIDFLGNVESIKENFPTTAKPASFGLFAKINIARKAAAGDEPGDLISREDLRNFADEMGAEKNIGRAFLEYTTRNYVTEKQRKEEQREMVQKVLDKWLKDRELKQPSTPAGHIHKKFVEKCMNYGSTLDSDKKMNIRPCCIKCCSKSYLGCL